MKNTTAFSALLILALATGCSNLTHFAPARDQNVSLAIRQQPTAQLPATIDLASTSFGQYAFQAKSGEQTMYGLLPLRFRGDYLALDILFFAPAMFFNLRTTFDHYEFDVAASALRYRDDDNDPWITHRPTDAEIANARRYFEAKASNAGSGSVAR